MFHMKHIFINNQINMRFLEELKEFKLPNDKFAIFGSGPMAIRGICENNDIDIIVNKELWNKLKAKYPKLVNINDIKLTKNIEIWSNWPNFDIDKLIRESEIIDGIRFVGLDRVLEWKNLRKREKDLHHIKLIEGYMKEFHT